MAKLVNSPVKNQLIVPKQARVQISSLFSTSLSGGMNSSSNPRNIPENTLSLLQNVGVFYDDIVRRYPLTKFSTKPDSEKVLNFVSWAKNDGSVKLLRFVKDHVYLGTSTWNSLAGTLTGGDTDRFSTAIVNDRFFFANNGADYIQEINAAATSFARLGNAPKYRFITGFANRVVGANDASGSPTEVGWSGNLNLAVWDSITDQSAGKSDLIESTSDLADPISGLFGGSNTLIVIRQRSIWEATKSGVASNPFNFATRVPGIGSDAPNSIVRIPGGICFLDKRTEDIYAYIDSQLMPLSAPVKPDIFSSITDPSTIFASYNSQLKQYSVCIPNSNSTHVRQWTYSFEFKTWWYEDYTNISMLVDLDYSGSTTTINDLTGTIDQLIGTINSLSSGTNKVTRFYGTKDGEIEQFTSNLSDINITDLNFVTDARTKIVEFPSDDIYVNEIRVEYVPLSTIGGFSINYSTDGGITFKPAKLIIFTQPSDIGKNKLVIFKKLVKAREFMVQIYSTLGLFKIENYEIYISRSADSRT